MRLIWGAQVAEVQSSALDSPREAFFAGDLDVVPVAVDVDGQPQDFSDSARMLSFESVSSKDAFPSDFCSCCLPHIWQISSESRRLVKSMCEDSFLRPKLGLFAPFLASRPSRYWLDFAALRSRGAEPLLIVAAGTLPGYLQGVSLRVEPGFWPALAGEASAASASTRSMMVSSAVGDKMDTFCFAE